MVLRGLRGPPLSLKHAPLGQQMCIFFQSDRKPYSLAAGIFMSTAAREANVFLGIMGGGGTSSGGSPPPPSLPPLNPSVPYCRVMFYWRGGCPSGGCTPGCRIASRRKVFLVLQKMGRFTLKIKTLSRAVTAILALPDKSWTGPMRVRIRVPIEPFDL